MYVALKAAEMPANSPHLSGNLICTVLRRHVDLDLAKLLQKLTCQGFAPVDCVWGLSMSVEQERPVAQTERTLHMSFWLSARASMALCTCPFLMPNCARLSVTI